MAARPAVQKARELGKDLSSGTMDEEARKHLFGQTAASVKEAEAARGAK
jgi:hypothetical protein